LRAGVLVSKGHRHHKVKLNQSSSHGGPSNAQTFNQERMPKLYGQMANIKSCHKWGTDVSWQPQLSLCE